MKDQKQTDQNGVPAPPPCLPWVGIQTVGDTKCHLRDLQGFTCRK